MGGGDRADAEARGWTVSELVGDPAVLDDPSIGVLQRVLLNTDGYVVRLLQACYGETVRAADRVQLTEPMSPDDDEFEPAGAEPVLRRAVLLRGARTGRVYVAADSAVALDRLDPGMAEKLLSTDEPIGRLLAAYRVETFREFRQVGRARAGTLGQWFGLDCDAELLFRSYRMISAGRPIALITEYFPRQSLATEWAEPDRTGVGAG